MLEVLQFVLSGFWIFVGTVVLIYAAGESIAAIVAAVAYAARRNKP